MAFEPKRPSVAHLLEGGKNGYPVVLALAVAGEVMVLMGPVAVGHMDELQTPPQGQHRLFDRFFLRNSLVAKRLMKIRTGNITAFLKLSIGLRVATGECTTCSSKHELRLKLLLKC
jgi:hypothetical protein